MKDQVKQVIVIPPQSGAAVNLNKKERLRVIDLEGRQVADLLAYNWYDPREYLSTAATIDVNGSLNIYREDCLYSNKYKPMLLLIEDTVGRHDLLHPPCRPEMYKKQYGINVQHPSCFENFARLLMEYGLDDTFIYTPLNIFMNTHVRNDEMLEIKRPVSRPDDYILLEALMDLLVVVTACSVAESNCNDYNPTSIRIEILAQF
ncbi:MAG: DUF1989 domain-containing protein [Bacillota bacterium]